MADPHPLKPGHIAGQNPAVPERVVGHTGVVGSEPFGNDADFAGRPAFLFRAGARLGVTLDSSGANLLTPARGTAWELTQYLTLGSADGEISSMGQDAVVEGIRAHRYCVWRA